MKEEIKQRIELLKNGQVPQDYKKTKVGIIPINWEIKNLGKIGKFKKGKGVSKNNITLNGLPAVMYGDIYVKYNIKFDKVDYKISEEDSKNSTEVYNGDLLFTCSGETALEIGKCVCYVGNKVIYIGGDIIALTPKDYNSLFLSYQQNSYSYIKKKARLGQGNSVVHIYEKFLSSINLSLPPLKEQQKIADILTTQDKLIELKQKLIEEKEKQKKYLIQNLLTGKIRLKGFNDKWEKVKLGDILKEFNEKTTILNQYEVISSTSKGLFYQKDYFNKEVVSINNIGYKILKINQLVFSPQNLYLGNINFNSKFKIGMVSPSYKVFEIKNCNKIFISYIIKIPRMLYEYELASKQGASIVRRNLDINLFYLIKINLPPLEEQNKIAEVLSKADEEIELLKRDLEQEKDKKKALMQLLLTGIVRV